MGLHINSHFIPVTTNVDFIKYVRYESSNLEIRSTILIVKEIIKHIQFI